MNNPLHHIIHLEGAVNIRDLGGYLTGNGQAVRAGQFIRGARLDDLSDADLDTLAGYGVTDIIDLRSRRELAMQPDRWLEASMEHHHVPLLDGIQSELAAGGVPEIRVYPASMPDLYVSLLDSSAQQFRQIFTLLARAEGGCLFHCTAGKDRTGLVAMLLLDLAGVPRQTIVADYAVSGDLIHESIETASLPQDLRYLLESQPYYIEAAIEHLYAHHSGAQGYLLSVGVSPGEINRILGKLLGS